MIKTIKISILLAVLLLAAWLTPSLVSNPGLIQIEALGYQIQMTVITAMLLVAALFVIIWAVYGLLRAPQKAMSHLSANHSRKKFARGLLALSEGRWPQAEQLLLASAKKSPTPELSYMAAARAAVAQNHMERAEAHLDQAEAVIDNPLTVDLTRCEIWIKSNQAERAMPLLDGILKTYPNNPRGVHLLTQASQQLGDWGRLQDNLPKAEKLALISHEQSNELKRQATLAQMDQAANSEELLSIWHQLNKKQQHNYSHPFCENGLRVGAYAAITEHIEKAQKQQFDTQLVNYWSELPHNLNHRLKVAEKWLQKHPESPSVLTCNAKLHMAKKHWDQAESLLIEVLKREPSAEINQLLATTYQQQNQPDKALSHFEQSVKSDQGIIQVIDSK